MRRRLLLLAVLGLLVPTGVAEAKRSSGKLTSGPLKNRKAWVKKRKVVVRKPAVRPPAGPVATGLTGTPASSTPLPGASAPAATAPASEVATAQPATPGPSVPPAPATTPLGVTAREFSLVLSRTSVPAGPVRVQLVNRGEDPHDLAVRRAGIIELAIPETLPNAQASRTGTLTAGTYTLLCTLAGHEAAGMRASLTVTP